MQFETITTNRLILRKITPEVHKYAHTNFGDAELREFFALTTETAYEREMQMAQGGLTTFNKSFLWFHLLDKTSGAHIGWCGYHTWYTGHARAEIGYALYDDNYKGKGLMTEALRTVIDYGFNEMKLNRIEALIADYNIPSLKLVENFGFQKEGVLRGHYFVDGKAEDSVVFGLLQSEYQH
jgi:[ribosomal protein S5]-alanine N-acetyltransferase